MPVWSLGTIACNDDLPRGNCTTLVGYDDECDAGGGLRVDP